MDLITAVCVALGVGVVISIAVWWLEGQYYKRRRRREQERLRAIYAV